MINSAYCADPVRMNWRITLSLIRPTGVPVCEAAGQGHYLVVKVPTCPSLHKVVMRKEVNLSRKRPREKDGFSRVRQRFLLRLRPGQINNPTGENAVSP